MVALRASLVALLFLVLAPAAANALTNCLQFTTEMNFGPPSIGVPETPSLTLHVRTAISPITSSVIPRAACRGTLPAGLSVAFSSGRCVISGTPTVAVAAKTYTITAPFSEGCGLAVGRVNITVQ